MKKYLLRVNGMNDYYENLDEVIKFFKECGIEDGLELEDDEDFNFIRLDEISKLLNYGEVLIFNECMCEYGSDYCVIELDEIS